MGDIVNLNRYRKARKARDEKKSAAINRSKFGRNKAELLQLKSSRDRAESELGGKRLESKTEPKE